MHDLVRAVFFLLLPNIVFAGSWMGDFNVQNLVVEGAADQPIANISLVPNPQTTCNDNTFVTLDTSTKLGNQALSVFLTAATTKSKIKVYIDGCVGARPKILNVWLISS